MRVVIDTNRMQSDELWAFLAMSQHNQAVLPDYLAMEAYKPNRLDRLHTRFSVLARFPKQVLILKGTADISDLTPDPLDPTQAMIDRAQSAEFARFCRALGAASLSPAIRKQLETRAGWANDQLDVMLDAPEVIAAAMDEFRAPFTKAELAAIRRKEPFTLEISRKFHGVANSIADRLFELRADVRPPTIEERKNHFVFRNALAQTYYMITRIRSGAILRRPAAERNDRVDVLLAAYGTYFDGVMSEDDLTNEVHYVVRGLLREQGAAVGRTYIAEGLQPVLDFLDSHADKAPGLVP